MSIPISVANDGYTEISGLRQTTAITIRRNGSLHFTVERTIQGGETHTTEIYFGFVQNMLALVKLVEDGVEIPVTMEGFYYTSYSYGEVAFRERMPEWDTEAYPYAFIAHFDTKIRLYAFEQCGYIEEIGDTVIYTLGGSYLNPDESLLLRYISYSYANKKWEQEESASDWSIAINEMLWANTDVLYSDDTVYYPKSGDMEIITVSDGVNRDKFLTGFALGLCGKPLPLSTGKKLVGYSYNGTVLPKLPEWDRGRYPYAFITKNAFGAIELFVLPSVDYFVPDGLDWAIATTDNLQAAHNSGSGWTELSAYSTAVSRPVKNTVWANFDVLNEDDTVYLAASEPVPVYE